MPPEGMEMPADFSGFEKPEGFENMPQPGNFDIPEGFDSAEFIGKWNGYDVFCATSKKPMKIDICFGVEERYDVDNMIKSFLDTLVSYYGLKNDNGFYEINMKKEIVKTQEEGYIAFNIANIAA